MNRDPLEEFFARERGEVRELAPAPGHWNSLVERSRRPAGRGWLPYVAVAAAAAVVGGVLATDALQENRSDDVTAATSSTSLATQPSVQPSLTTPAPTTSDPVASSTHVTTVPSGPLPVPASFDLVSMTSAGDGHLYAIGAAKCPKGPCTSVVASEDDGRTWTARSTFEDLVPAGARATPDAPGEVVGVRFATPEVGYVFGSTLRRTTDGGRSWQDVDVDRRVVLSLETDGSRVWMATARSCTHDKPDRGCSDLQPRTASVADAGTTVVTLDGMPTKGDNAWIALDGEDAYYNVSLPDAAGTVPAMRLSDIPAVLPVPQGCAEGMWVSGTANARGTLFALCRSADRPQEQYSLAVSTDRGAGWSTREAPDLGTPGEGGVWLTATDATHLVAVRGGQPSSTAASAGTGLLVSSDGGTHWRAPKATPSVPLDWAGAAGGRLVYAVGGGGSYWASRDGGESFTPVRLRR